MKRPLIAAVVLALATASGVAGAASWSVIVQPGVYGRVAIGGYAEAPLVYAPQPVVAIDNGYGEVVEESVDAAYATDQTPVYLWVPEYQRLHWAQYCREYGAYGVPVYFVDDGWYRANVLRRNWTPEQRSWTPQQWMEQDRLARDRVERQRFEQQRYEQQQRWIQQRAWQDPQRAAADRERAEAQAQAQAQAQGQNRMVWGSARGVVQPPAQNNGMAHPQPGGQWQQAGSSRPGGLPANPSGGGMAWSGGNGAQQAQPPAASQPHGEGRGGAGAEAGERRGGERGQERGERGERRGQGAGRGGFEHGREGNRDR